jgi:hypothetical protein
MVYEWNMGQYVSSGTRVSDTFTKKLSDDLSEQFVTYINELGLKDDDGNTLTLSTTTSNSGTYYNYLKSVIETSLNNFLEDTTFPYTPSSSEQGDGGFGGGRRRLTTYNSVSDYISSLNSDEEWITYDSSSNTATISSVGSFVKHCKSPTKDVGAFDSLSKSQAENKLFGINSTYSTSHFDEYMSELLSSNTYSSFSDWDSNYPSNYANDLQEVDSLGKTVLYRSKMYNPLYYLLNYYDGYNTSNVASYFRINTGIAQGDTANVVEMNLALALKNFGKNVEFTTVWEEGHNTAERGGSSYSTSNFISWVADCMGVDSSDSSSSSSSSDSSSIYIDY